MELEQIPENEDPDAQDQQTEYDDVYGQQF